MLRILVYLWPVLLPVVAYLVWLWIARRRARVSGHDVLPGLKDGPWVWMAFTCLLVAAGCFLYMALGAERTAHYRPAHMQGGTLVGGEARP